MSNEVSITEDAVITIVGISIETFGRAHNHILRFSFIPPTHPNAFEVGFSSATSDIKDGVDSIRGAIMGKLDALGYNFVYLRTDAGNVEVYGIQPQSKTV